MSQKFFISRSAEGGWNPEGYRKWLMEQFPVTFELEEFEEASSEVYDIENKAIAKVEAAFEHKLAHEAEMIRQAQKEHADTPQPMQPEEILKEVVRNILIRTLDKLWQGHLLNIDHLRTEVHLRVVGQKDPLLEFKHEAFALFNELTFKMKEEIAHALFKFQMVMPARPEPKPEKRTRLDFRTSLSELPELTTHQES